MVSNFGRCFWYRGHANAANKCCQNVLNRLELILRSSLTVEANKWGMGNWELGNGKWKRWAGDKLKPWTSVRSCASLYTITIADYSCLSCSAASPLIVGPFAQLALVACLRPKRRRCRCHWRFMSTAAAAQYSNSLHSLITCRQLVACSWSYSFSCSRFRSAPTPVQVSRVAGLRTADCGLGELSDRRWGTASAFEAVSCKIMCPSWHPDEGCSIVRCKCLYLEIIAVHSGSKRKQAFIHLKIKFKWMDLNLFWSKILNLKLSKVKEILISLLRNK